VNSCRKILALNVLLLIFLGACGARAERKPKNEDCLTCHGDKTLTTEVNGKQVSLYVDGGKLNHSIHGSMFTCVDCHKDVKGLVHESTPKKISCTDCHADAQQAYGHSLHAKAGKNGAPAATCVDCHSGPHEVVGADDPKSPVSRLNIPATCGRCHAQKFLMESNGVSNQPFISYQDSVHGRAVAKGSMKAAVCTDCHGSHEILPPSDPKSPIYKPNVPKTCGKCHAQIMNTYNVSIHGQAIQRGNSMSPVCTDCHGIHSIQSHKDPNSPVADQNLSRDTCARCHEGVRLSKEFGVPGNRVSSYMDSYHGLATQGGSTVAANCSSCHGAHDILPSSDPRSTINHAHLQETCGKCHQGATTKFTQARVHLDDGLHPKDIDSLAVRIVRLIYIPLIILVIGGMAAHNIIIWRSKLVRRRQMHNPMMKRMTVNQRWQHLVLLTSFIVLVITGFALKFPESWFADLLHMSEHVRSIVHRIAGVALIAAGIYHMFYLVAAREGRRLLRDIAPRPKDLKDVIGTMLYYMGMSQTKPEYGRFTYGEKAEYWALVWGTALMGLTGIMLWAKVWVGDIFARWWVDVATSIHYYEAILATLAILVWHFYQVIFDPDVYPMNAAWWDGKMPLDHYKHEHALDTETLAEIEGAKPAEEKSEGGEK
jgi:cytochrome b subunit of formate dehydrogenase